MKKGQSLSLSTIIVFIIIIFVVIAVLIFLTKNSSSLVSLIKGRVDVATTLANETQHLKP